jgi:hypothetical protein
MSDTDASTSRNARDGRSRSRSFLSEKKLGRSVVEGRKVRFEFPTGIPKMVSGYVCGWDTYHWFVLSFDSTGKVTEHLVHKSAALVTITSDTITSEASGARSLYEEVVVGFRKRLTDDGVVPEHLTPRSA